MLCFRRPRSRQRNRQHNNAKGAEKDVSDNDITNKPTCSCDDSRSRSRCRHKPPVYWFFGRPRRKRRKKQQCCRSGHRHRHRHSDFPTCSPRSKAKHRDSYRDQRGAKRSVKDSSSSPNKLEVEFIYPTTLTPTFSKENVPVRSVYTQCYASGTATFREENIPVRSVYTQCYSSHAPTLNEQNTPSDNSGASTFREENIPVRSVYTQCYASAPTSREENFPVRSLQSVHTSTNINKIPNKLVKNNQKNVNKIPSDLAQSEQWIQDFYYDEEPPWNRYSSSMEDATVQTSDYTIPQPTERHPRYSSATEDKHIETIYHSDKIRVEECSEPNAQQGLHFILKIQNNKDPNLSALATTGPFPENNSHSITNVSRESPYSSSQVVGYPGEPLQDESEPPPRNSTTYPQYEYVKQNIPLVGEPPEQSPSGHSPQEPEFPNTDTSKFHTDKDQRNKQEEAASPGSHTKCPKSKKSICKCLKNIFSRSSSKKKDISHPEVNSLTAVKKAEQVENSPKSHNSIIVEGNYERTQNYQTESEGKAPLNNSCSNCSMHETQTSLIISRRKGNEYCVLTKKAKNLIRFRSKEKAASTKAASVSSSSLHGTQKHLLPEPFSSYFVIIDPLETETQLNTIGKDSLPEPLSKYFQVLDQKLKHKNPFLNHKNPPLKEH